MRFYKPSIKRSDMQSVLMSMADEQIGPGKRCVALTDKLREFLPFKNMTLLRSPVTAFLLCLDALGIGEGDKVVASCFIPLFYKDLLEEAGVEIIYADVNRDNGLIDPEATEKAEGAKSAKVAFFGGHLGFVPDAMAFKSKKMKTLCDLTECVGCPAPAEGVDAAILSLEDDKMVTAAGGACVMSNALDFGKPVREELLGDLNASLGLMQLENYPFYCKKRLEIRSVYAKSVEVSSNRIFSHYDEKEGDNAFRFAVLLENFKDALRFLERKKIPVRKAFAGTAYEELDGKERFPNASYLYGRVYCFPLYYYMKSDEIETVRKVLSALP